MNQQNQSFLAQSWVKFQIQNIICLSRDRLGDQLSGHCFVDVCGGV
jgi:hypothetical protein